MVGLFTIITGFIVVIIQLVIDIFLLILSFSEDYIIFNWVVLCCWQGLNIIIVMDRHIIHPIYSREVASYFVENTSDEDSNGCILVIELDNLHCY